MRAETALETAGRQLCWLPLSDIVPNRMQSRLEFDDFALMELVASIKQNGLLQPVTVRLLGQGMWQEVLARMLGKSVPAISNRLRLLRLEPSVREVIAESGLSERHARALLPLPGEEGRLRIARLAAAQKLSVQKTEQLVAKALERLPVPAGHRRMISLARDPRLYINAIRGIVQQLRDTGLETSCEVREYETAVEMRIMLPKAKGGRAFF